MMTPTIPILFVLVLLPWTNAVVPDRAISSQNRPYKSELSGQCSTIHGNAYFRVHSHRTHQPEKSLQRFLKDLITCGHTDTEQALKEAIVVLWTRLGHIRKCSQKHNIGSSIEEYGGKLADHFIHEQTSHANSSMLLESHYIYNLFKNLLQKGLSNDDCCVDQSTSCISHPRPRHSVDLKNISRTFNQIRNVYHQDYHLPNITTAIKYLSLENANRMLCVYEDDFQKPATSAHDVVPTLVTYILLGYNFKQSGEACPMTFVHDIFKTYANSADMALSERELQTLMRRLNLTQASLHDHQAHHKERNHAPRASDAETETTRLGIHNQLNRIDVSGTHNAHRDGQLTVSGRFAPGTTHNHNQHDDSGTDPSQEHTQHGSNHHSISEVVQLYGLNTLDIYNTSLTDKCLSPIEIHRMFANRPTRTMDVRSFLDICPVLLQQVLTESCRTNRRIVTTVESNITTQHLQSTNSTNTTLSAEQVDRNRGQEYLYGSLSVLVISVCSLFGAVFMKLSSSAMKHYIMGCMLALAVGCLVADAILHLLPEISALDTKESSGDQLLPDNLQKLCSMLASIYGFFLLELYLCRKGQGHSHVPLDQPNTKTVTITENKGERIKYRNVTPVTRASSTQYINNQLQRTTPTYSSVQQELRKLDNIVASNTDSHQDPGQAIELSHIDLEPEQLHETCSNHSSNTTDREAPAHQSVDFTAKRAIAWMIIIGDAVHNFADGLAVGAAFSLSFTKGLSTSITIFCHELPHELGDFAVLISTGMTVKRAMVFNFLSSLTAFVGLYIGLVLGDQPEASKWIFAIGAGMFLYVAMTDLIPECKEYFKRTPNWKMFLGQNIGVLVGYVGMLLLAMFEEKLEIQLQ